jgi:hypothetical protein
MKKDYTRIIALVLLIVVLFVGWIALNGGLKFGIISEDIDIHLPF